MYRDIVAPSRALEALLKRLNRRMSALEKRARWSGATRIERASGTTVPRTTTWTDLVSITLDPGSWLIIAGTTLVRGSSSGGYASDFEIPGVDGATAAYDGLLNTGSTNSTTLVLQAQAELSAETTLTARARYSTFIGGQPDAVDENTYILAYPA